MGLVRVSRDKFVVPRCTQACPAGIDVPRYIRAVKDGRYDDAVAVVREKIPLPTVCADACFAPCEDMCAYKQFGDPIAIRAIKRFAVDHGGDLWKDRKKTPEATGRKAAIVGAGPAGLTCAYYLAGKGHRVTIFEAFPQPGGAMRYGIPDYRLPADRLDRDIRDILELGIDFRGETVVGKDILLDQLQQEFDAIFIGCGASKSSVIPLVGADKEGVLWGWEFLRDVALGKVGRLDGDLVVVGGGNVAMDVALTARRLGAREVSLFCLEKREEMPAHGWEIDRAEEEGVVIHNAWGPQKVLGDGRTSGLRMVRCLSVFDRSGAFRPVFDEETTFKAPADYVILAVGQTSDLGFAKNNGNLNQNQGRIEAKEADLATGEKRIFAGGDVVSGPASIISAIAHGRKAAAAMDRFLGGDGIIDEVLAPPENGVTLSEWVGDVRPRVAFPLLKPWQRKGFDQVEQGLTRDQIAAESGRCLSCDARRFEVTLNTEYCKECGYCVEVCGVGTFGPSASFNAKGYLPMECKSSDGCVGCFKCYFACPDFAIDVREATGEC